MMLPEPGPLDLRRYFVHSCVILSFVCVRGRKARLKEDTKKNGGPSTPLKYTYQLCIFLYLCQNLLPLTNGPKKKTNDGRTKDATFFLGISFCSCD
jgi:hypothetical protein